MCIILTICMRRSWVESSVCDSTTADSSQRDTGSEGYAFVVGGRRSKGTLKEVVWSGMVGLKSLSTSGHDSGALSCSALRCACWTYQSLSEK